jgi:hypothetical protein
MVRAQVSSVWDVRNVGTLAAYGALLALLAHAAAKPRLRRGLAEALAWGCLPFVPASGVFARVGTLLAERLLYLPSVGYALLLGWLLAAAEAAALSSPPSVSSSSLSSPLLSPPSPAAAPSRCRHRRHGLARGVAWAGVALLARRTRQRIPAWASDWALFHAAQVACPTSAKTRHQVRAFVLRAPPPLPRTLPTRLVHSFLFIPFTIAFVQSRKRFLIDSSTVLRATLFLSLCGGGVFVHGCVLGVCAQVGQLWLNQRQDAAAALAHFEAALSLDPQFCDAEYSTALARVQLGDWSSLESAARSATPLCPKPTRTLRVELSSTL